MFNLDLELTQTLLVARFCGVLARPLDKGDKGGLQSTRLTSPLHGIYRVTKSDHGFILSVPNKKKTADPPTAPFVAATNWSLRIRAL